MVLSFLEEELVLLESRGGQEEGWGAGHEATLSSSLWLDEVVMHLIPVTEQARCSRRIEDHALFLKIAVLFRRGWLLITSNLRTVPPVQHTLDLFLSQWTSTLPLLIAFAADTLIHCSSVMVELLCEAMQAIHERLSNTHYEDRGGAVVAEWNINHEVVLEFARSLVRVGTSGKDDTTGTMLRNECCCVGMSMVASPFLYLCAAHGVRDYIQRFVSTLVVDDLTMQRVFVAPPWKLHVDRLADAAASLDAVVRSILHNHIARFLKRAVLPALYCEKWSSNAKYFGGRQPSHSISFYFGALLIQAKRNNGACRPGTAALEAGRAPLTPLSCSPNEPRCRQIAQDIFSCSLLTFLNEYFAFLWDAASLKATSDNRREQLKTDVMYVVRLTRICRLLLCPQQRTEVDLVLLRIVAAASVRFSATDDLADASAAEVPCCFEPPHSFMERVWDVQPIRGWMELHQSSCASLSPCHHEGFVRWVSHTHLMSLTLPSPHLDVRCLLPTGSDNEGAAQYPVLCLPSPGVRRLYQTLQASVVGVLLAASQ